MRQARPLQTARRSLDWVRPASKSSLADEHIAFVRALEKANRRLVDVDPQNLLARLHSRTQRIVPGPDFNNLWAKKEETGSLLQPANEFLKNAPTLFFKD